jgi:hypothetical protein
LPAAGRTWPKAFWPGDLKYCAIAWNKGGVIEIFQYTLPELKKGTEQPFIKINPSEPFYVEKK